jgi:hypothetical protein
MGRGVSVNPAYFGRECVHCGAHFKVGRFDRQLFWPTLHAVDDREWERDFGPVAAPDQ